MQERTIKDEDAAALIAQVEGEVISGPTKTKRGVGRLKKALSGPPEPPRPLVPTVRAKRNGEVVMEIMAPPEKPLKNQEPPNFLEVEKTVNGETVTQTKGPYWGSRRMRRVTIGPYIRHQANAMAKASIAAKKAAMIQARRDTPMVTKAERLAALAVA